MAKKAYIGVDGVARKVKKGYVGVHQVPQAQYAVLEYIESTGTQYFDTGVTVKSNLVSQLKFNSTAITGDVLYGSYPNSDTADYRLFNYEGLCTLDLPGGSGHGNRIHDGTMSAGVDYDVEVGNFYVKDLTSNTYFASSSPISFSEQSNTMKMWLFEGSTHSCSSGKLYYLKIYEDTTLVRNFIPVKRLSDNSIGLYDKVGKQFYTNKGTGVFDAGAETGEYIYNIPQEGGFARRIKKAYIGVGGVARPCWSGGEITYYGTVTPLSTARSRGCGVGIGKYALYAGGENGSSSALTVTDAYDAQLVRTLPASLAAVKTNGGVARVGRYAVFAGGATGNNYTVSPTTVYDEDLTRTADAALNLGWAQYGGGVTGKSHAVFGDGYKSYSSLAGEASAVDADLVKTALTPFSVPRGYYGAAATGECVLFAGGYNGSYLSAVDAYGPDLEKRTAPSLPVTTICPGSAEAGNYAVIAGGRSGSSGYTNSVSAYSPDMTLTAVPSLSAARHLFHSVSFGGCAIFAGGCNANTWYSTVDCYDEDLTHSLLTSLSAAREEYNNANGRGAVVGDFALLFGGRNNSGYFDAVDAFELI